MQKITPCLWFDQQAEEAVNFYLSVFSAWEGSSGKKSKITHVAHYGEEGAKVAGRPKGSVMTILFELEGEQFMALNGGPMFTFNHALSLMVNCDTQEQIDHFWTKLSEGGVQESCGWLKDKFGLSWQVVPRVLGEMMRDKDPKKTERVMHAIFHMKKIDIQSLEQAFGQ